MIIKNLIKLLMITGMLSLVSITDANQKIDVGIYQNYPLCFIDKDDSFKGIYIDLMNYIASHENWDIRYHVKSWKESINLLDNNKVNFLCGIAYTSKRAEKYIFNKENVFVDWGVIYLPKNSKIESIIDLQGKKIATVEEGILLKSLSEILDRFEIKCKFIEVKEPIDVLKKIEQGEADAGTALRLFGLQHLSKFKIKKSTIIFSPLQLRFAASDQNSVDFLNILDKYLLEFKKNSSSFYYESIEHWLDFIHPVINIPGWLKWLIYAISGAVMFLFLLSVVFKKQIKLKTKELEKQNRELNIQIWERTQFELALRMSEEKYRSFIEDVLGSSSVGVFILNSDFKVIWLNHALERFFGLQKDEIIGKDKRQLIKNHIARIFQDPNRFIRKVLATYDNNTYVENFECYILPTEGKQGRWLEHWSQPIKSGLYAGGRVEHYTDITDRKIAEEYLRESELRFRSTFEQAAVGICHADPNGKFLRTNHRFSDIVGYSQNEMISLKWQDITYPDDLETDLQNVQQVIDNKIKTYSMEKRFIRKDNYMIWVNLTVSLVRESNGAPQYFIGVIEDINYRKKIEEKLQQSKKIEAIATLAGGIAHDFNNMLGVITGNISYALSLCEKNTELNDVLIDAQEGAIHAQNLTLQLLTFAKGGEPIKKTHNINNLLKESAIFVTRGAKSKCDFKLADDIWPAEIDSGQINQVISNLIINADQAMPQGGIITIKSKNINIETISEFHQSTLPIGRYINISIEDQGIGIQKKNLHNIFDPYFTTKQKGSGLGLATVYSIVKRHGGYINVYSDFGKGTVFNIYLPASIKSFLESKKILEDHHTGKGKILIMDDQEPILKMLERMLKQMGYETTLASNGKEAVEIYCNTYKSKNKFDLVILDLTIPGGMGGTKTMSELLKIDPSVKAVVSSGYSNDPIMANYQDYGFCDVVPKPYTKAQISKVLNNIFG